jgi:epidermal growth factor receptor kinase substrate 8
MAYHTNGYSGDERDLERDDDLDKHTYIMEHLATFTVSKEIAYPADGMRKLLQLEKSNGIWSQKMQLCLDKGWVLIMDYETGTVMERFAGKTIKEPTAYTSQDPMEMYNNILVFIVTNPNPNRPAEMHIFQCQGVSAQDLVADLKDIQKGKPISRNRKSSVPMQNKPPPHHVINPSRDYRESDSELMTNNDDNSSTTSEQYEKDVTVLNHCFDDIEKFIARLQHVAAATKELERRKRSRKGKKDAGDGMLTMRTKPPNQKEFNDIFQKFKLSFNLLAKLKAHIHDPNAPELVHFLFTPLALIVEAAHDTYPDQHIPNKVISPLLTREAIILLNNCVTSKETELWHSLGQAWIIPRDEWKGPVATYHPVFMDNWSPDYPVVDELEPDKHYRNMHDSDYDYDPNAPENMFAYDPKDDREHDPNMSASRSDISVDSIEKNEDRSFKKIQENYLETLQKKNAYIVQVTYPRTANNDKELTVVRGEFLEILDDSRKWWKARNHRSQVAHVPHTIVQKVNYQSDVYNNPIYNPSYKRNESVESVDYLSSIQPSSADVVRQERLGKKGEFRYF